MKQFADRGNLNITLKINYNLNILMILLFQYLSIILFYINGAGINLLHSKDAVKT